MPTKDFKATINSILQDHSKEKVNSFIQKYPHLEEGICVLVEGINKKLYSGVVDDVILDILHIHGEERLADGKIITKHSGYRRVDNLVGEGIGLLFDELQKDTHDPVLAKITADIYFKGIAGKHDMQKALELFQHAADQGDPYAQTYVGECYSRMYGIEFDDKIVHHYTLAANQGFSEANAKLGLCFQGQFGVERDDVEAVRNFQLAMDKGGSGIQNHLARYRETGCTPLISTSISGNVESVAKCLKEGADINQAWKGKTPLTYAVEYGHQKLVNQMIADVAGYQNNSRPGYFSFGADQHNGADWREFISQLDNSRVRNLLTRESVILLDVILPESSRDLKTAIRNNFNDRNKDNPINKDDLAQIRDLKEIKHGFRQSMISSNHCEAEAEALSIKSVVAYYRPQIDNAILALPETKQKLFNPKQAVAKAQGSSIYETISAILPSSATSTRKEEEARPLLGSTQATYDSTTKYR